jgi:hypothetical protein
MGLWDIVVVCLYMAGWSVPATFLAYDVVGNAERLTDIMKLSSYLSINYVRLNTNTLRQYIHCHNI